MQLQLSQLLPSDFSSNSKVWIYQSSRPFNDREELEINEQLYNFYVQWKSHGADVKGWAKLLFKQLVVVIADETDTGVGGCSTDTMVRVIKSFERQYNVNMFDRYSILFLVKEKVEALPMQQLPYALSKGFIKQDTLLFNNLVENYGALSKEWLMPLSKTWLWTRLKLDNVVVQEQENFSEN